MDEQIKRLEENIKKLQDLQARLRFILRDITRLVGVRIDDTEQTESSSDSDVGNGRDHLDGTKPEPSSLADYSRRRGLRRSDGDR